MSAQQQQHDESRQRAALVVSAELQRCFRDLVRDRRLFTKPAIERVLDVDPATARELIAWGLRRYVIEDLGELRTGQRGRPPHVYRYLERAPERSDPRADADRRRRFDGAGIPTRSQRVSDRDVAQLLEAARRRGATIKRSGSGHWVVRSRSGARVVIAQSASDHRSIANARAQLRRAGINV